MKRTLAALLLFLLLAGCAKNSAGKQNPTAPTLAPGPTPTLSAAEARIPAFQHVIVILFENRNFDQVIGSDDAPTFNRLANQYALLTDYYAVAHPSLPNYIALTGGDTFGIQSDCTSCFINQPSLPDLIEASGRTWKTYQEDLPSPCFVGSSGGYAQKHDPFIYFDPIRTDAARCQKSVVPLAELDRDLAANTLPDYAFIMPNLCNSAHDCALAAADKWLDQLTRKLLASPALGQNYLLFITFDESSLDSSSCCGLPRKAGGKVAAILVSPLVQGGDKDATPLTHYSWLKTLAIAWKLPQLGYAGQASTSAITAPWK